MENVKKRQHANIQLKSDFKFIKPTYSKGRARKELGLEFVLFTAVLVPTPVCLAPTKHLRKMCQIHYLLTFN